MFCLDPLRDPRWPELLKGHPRASVFHTPAWLEALRRTYGYDALAFTTTPPGRSLENGIVFCRVESLLTGRRLVSLPFSDHCQPLVGSGAELAELLRDAEESARERVRYLELRPLCLDEFSQAAFAGFRKSGEYCFHNLDLRSNPGKLFRNFHKACVQNRIRRAERAGLSYEVGRSESLLGKFYGLLLLTRRRHGLPPQPMAWFRNLANCLGDALTVRVLSKGNQPIAGILTLSDRSTLVYKYGCSDARFHCLGGMPLLFWNAIQEALQDGAEDFDLGRSDLENAGLIAFKDHLGAVRFKSEYYKHPAPNVISPRLRRVRQFVRRAVTLMPGPALRAAGSVLYKHVG